MTKWEVVSTVIQVIVLWTMICAVIIIVPF
jgi:hypothetical protein